MSDRAWRLDELAQQPLAAESPSPSLVTMHFLLNALRRRWPVWIGLGCAGMLLGTMWAVTLPPASVGTVTLFLAHDPGVDPLQAQSTDVSLLRTRTLAVDVVEELGLQMAPEEFQQSVVSVPASPDVLVLEVSGPNDMAAVARARALAEAYLSFRASQIRSQLEALTHGYRKRITSLRKQIAGLNNQYEETRTSSPGDDQQMSALLNRQAQLATQIETARQSIDDAELKNDAVIESSYVLDPASPKPPPSAIITVLLAAATGLIGGTAVGIAFVLVMALTSNRLRLREDVALALDAPVRVSVRGRLPRSRWPLGRRVRLPATALGVLVDALDRQVARPPGPWPPLADKGTDRRQQAGRRFETIRLALATVDTGRVGELVMVHLAARLSAEGLDVFVVDLTESGRLKAALDRVQSEQKDPNPRRRPAVHRPDRVPSLIHGPLGSAATFSADPSSTPPWLDAWEHADVSLALAEVDPAVGAESLRSWTDDVVLLVAAGRSSAERLRATGELIRSAGLRLLFAMMVGTDHSDETPGLSEVHRAWRFPARSGAPSTPAHGRHSR